MSNQTGTKRSNEVMALERRVAQLEALIKQIPSRFASPSPPRNGRVVRVRFNFSYDDDLSEGELLTDAALTDQQTLVWVDGVHAMTVMPPQDFGDAALYWAESLGTKRIGAVTRQLYRVITPIAGTLSGNPVPEIQFEYQNLGNCGKLLTLGGASIQTTLAGLGQENRIRVMLETSSNGYRYDWTRRLRLGARAIPDGGITHAPGSYYRASSPMRSGCFIGIDGGSIGGISIDDGEPFRIDVWAMDGQTAGAAAETILIVSQHTAAIMFCVGGNMYGNGIGGTIQMRYDNFWYNRQANSSAPTWAIGSVTATVDISTSNGSAANITLTFTRTSGRITAISSALTSSYDVSYMKYRIMVTGGRAAAMT